MAIKTLRAIKKFRDDMSGGDLDVPISDGEQESATVRTRQIIITV
jgi:hypothetical protein